MTATKRPSIKYVFTPQAESIIQSAKDSALSCLQDFILPENLLLALLTEDCAAKEAIVRKINTANVDMLYSKLSGFLDARSNKHAPKTKTGQSFSKELEAILKAAEEERKASSVTGISTIHLLLGMLKFPHFPACLLLTFYGVTFNPIKTETVKNLLLDPPPPTQPATPTIMVQKDEFDRKEWEAVLETAFEIAKSTGVSIPAAFIQASFTTKSVVSSELVRIIQDRTIDRVVNQVVSLIQ